MKPGMIVLGSIILIIVIVAQSVLESASQAVLGSMPAATASAVMEIIKSIGVAAIGLFLIMIVLMLSAMFVDRK